MAACRLPDKDACINGQIPTDKVKGKYAYCKMIEHMYETATKDGLSPGSDEDESVATKEKISIAASRVPTSGEQANVRFSEVFAFLTKLKGGAGGSDATDVVLNLHSELEGTDADGGPAALQKKRGGDGSAPSVTKRAKRRSTAPTAPDSEDEEE